MSTGAPSSGGLQAPRPGGLSVPGPGGLTLTQASDAYFARVRGSAPNINLSRFDATGTVAQGAQSCTAIPHLGKATAVPTYAWTVPVRPGGAITPSTPTAATSTFTPDVPGTYIFRCTATFNEGTVAVKDFRFVATS